MADTPDPKAKPAQDPDNGYTVLRDADNRPVWYKPEDVAKGLAIGSRRETPEETKDRHLREWATDNPTLAGAAAAARTLSFGATGFIKSKEQEALAQENPAATTAGELGGLALPLAGEAGLMSKAARILTESKAARQAATVLDTVAKATGAPMRAAGAVGQAVGGAVGQVAGKAAGAAARFATEAELFNIGANVGEAALGDEELTADRLLAHSGQALALGAGLGLGGHAVTAGVSRLLEKSSSGIEQAQRFFNEQFPQVQSLQDAALAAKEAYVDHAAAASGRTKEFVGKMVNDIGTPEGMATRERLTKQLTNEETDQLGRAVAEPMQEAVEAIKKTFNEKVWEEVAPKQIEKLIGPRPLGPIVQDTQNVFGKLRSLESEMGKAPERYDDELLRKYNKAFNGYEDAIKGVIEEAEGGTKLVVRKPAKNAAEVFDNMIELRRDLDSMLKYDKSGADFTPKQRRTKEFIKEARDTIQAHLRNAEIYGEGASARARLDALSTKFYSYIGDNSEFARLFLSADGTFSSTKLATYLRQIEAFRGVNRQEAINEFFGAMRDINTELVDLAKQVDVQFSHSKLADLHTKATGARDIAAERLADSAKARQAVNDTTSLLERKTLGVATGATVGAVLGGPVGALAGAAAQYGYQMLKDPVLTGRTILAMERLSQKVSDDTRKSIVGFLGASVKAAGKAVKATGKAARSAARGTAQVVERTAAPASVYAMRDMLDGFDKKDLPKVQGGDKSDSARMRDFRQLEALLIDLTTNPDRAYDRYSQAFEAFRKAAPNVTDRLILKQLEAASYLYGKMPKNPSFGKTLNDAINDWKPSDQDLAKFERYVKAAQDPLSVLEDMKQGRITREGVETLQSLYPALYKSIQDVTFENLATLQKRLPYTQRINLSLLLNAPVDPSVTPAFVATMQGFYQGSVQSQIQGQQGGMKKAANGAGGSAIHPSQLKSFGKSLLTPAQSISYKSSLLK